MYLFHSTEVKYILKILKEGELKSSKLINNANYGEGHYNTSSSVFLSTSDILFNKKISRRNLRVIMYFSSDLLYNRNFYISNSQIPFPKSKKTKKEVKKYKRYYKDYDKVLEKLYLKSTLHDDADHFFEYSQQITINNKVNLNPYLVAIEFMRFKRGNKIDTNIDTNIEKYIEKNYPNIKMNYRDLSLEIKKNNY